MRRSAFGLLFTLSVLALAMVPLFGSGVTTVSANGGDVCISINGVVRVDTQVDGAQCASTQSDSGRPNIARAYDSGYASAGWLSTDSGNTATASGEGSDAIAGFGDDNTATATDGSVALARWGDNNTATATDGAWADIFIGDNNTATATNGGFAFTYEADNNTVTASGQDSTAAAVWGDNNTVTATGGCTAQVTNVDNQTVTCP